MLKNLDPNVKLELISMLSSSLVKPKKSMKNAAWLEQVAGRWQDDRSTDEILAEIYETRTQNKEVDL